MSTSKSAGPRSSSCREELAARVSPRAAVVPNGVIADVWRPRHPAPHANRSSSRGPRAIYTGTIDDRLEANLVELTAGAVGSLILMGQSGDSSVLRWLRSLDNVHFFEAVGQARARRDGPGLRHRRHPASGSGGYSCDVAAEVV